MTDPHAPATPVHAFADRAWDEFLERNPLWATAQGDERFDDRLDDPGPDGRAAELAMIDRWEGEMAALEAPGLSVEDRVTLGLIGVVVRRIRDGHRARALADGRHRPVQRAAGADRAPRTPPAARRAGAGRAAARPARGVSRLAPRARREHRGGDARRADGGAPGRRALHHPDAPHRGDAGRAVADPRRAPGARARRPRRDPSRTSSASSGPPRSPGSSSSSATSPMPAGGRASAICLAARSSTATTSSRTRRSTRTPAASTTTGSHGSRRSRARAGPSPRSSAMSASATCAARSTRTPRTTRPSPTSSSASPRRSSSGPRRSRRAGSAVSRATAARSDRSSRTWSRRRRRPSTMPPSEDGSRKGVYYINTFEPGSRHLHRLAATTFHEAVPGHHFQIAIEQELTGLPTFRRFGSRLAGAAYVEGWGLYAERLASEMGLYETPQERFGAAESEAWRAARLVVDTGIHHLGWTRQQSIDLLRERAGLSQLEAETETDRYISWPGQALAYMIGQREILDLRSDLTRRLGAAIRPPGVPRRGPRARVAAARDAPRAAPGLARRRRGLSVSWRPAPRARRRGARPRRRCCSSRARRGPCRRHPRARARG